MGLRGDFTRDTLGLYNVPEPPRAGKRSLTRYNSRGLQSVSLALSDELPGLRDIVRQAFPDGHHQLCLLHKLRALLTRIRARGKAALVADWHQVLALEQTQHIPEQFVHRLQTFIQQWATHCPSLAQQLPQAHWPNYCAYLHYPCATPYALHH